MDFKHMLRYPEEKVIYPTWAQQIVHEQRRDTLLILTEFFIYICRKSEQEVLVCANSFSYADLESADDLDEYTFRLSFRSKESYAFVEKNKTIFVTKIQMAINEIMLKKEMPKISLIKSIEEKDYNLYDLLIKRYRALMAWTNRYPATTVIETLRRFVSNYRTEVNLGVIEDYGFDLPIFLKSMQIQPAYKSVVVPIRPDSKYLHILQDFITSDSQITEITILEKIEDEFIQLFKLITQIPQVSLSKLTFKSLDLTTAAAELLGEFLKDHRLYIKCIKCNVVDSEKLLTSFMDTKNDNFIGIHMQSIMLAENVDFINAALRISHLTLISCGLQTNEIFTKLARTYAPKLESLDLSYNKCNQPFTSNISIPLSLKKLVLDHVEWISDNLLLVLQKACNGSNDFSLSINNIILTNDQWKAFWKALKNIRINAPSLISFSWKGNQVRHHLIGIIERSQIVFLSLAECNIKDKSSSLLGKYLDNTRTLKILDLHGSPNNPIDSKTIKSVLTHLPKCKTLRRLDLTDNQMASHSLYTTFIRSVSNCELHQMLCDGQNISDLKQFDDFVSVIVAKQKLEVRFPIRDLEKLCETASIAPEKMEYYKSSFKRPHGIKKDFPGYEEWNQLIENKYKDPIVEPPARSDTSAPVSTGSKRSFDSTSNSNSTSSFNTSNQSSNDFSVPSIVQFGTDPIPPQPPLIPPIPTSATDDDAPPSAFNIESRWQMDFVPVPEIDNTAIFTQFDRDFEVSKLIERLKMMS